MILIDENRIAVKKIPQSVALKYCRVKRTTVLGFKTGVLNGNHNLNKKIWPLAKKVSVENHH